MEAEIILSVNREKFELLNNIDLPEYFITSKAEIKISKEEKIEVKKALGKKCSRCWKILNNKCSRKNCPL